MANGVTRPPIFPLPDAFDFGAPAAERDMNPHIKQTGGGDIPTLPAKINTHFTRADFPKVVIPYDKLVANIAPEQIEQIQKNPAGHIAIVPLGAGKKYYRDNENCNWDILAFLKSFGFAGNDDIHLAKPIPRNANEKRDYEPPFPMILKGASAELRAYLLYQQTFALKADLAFNAIPFDTAVQSWVIMNITGDAVENSDRSKKQVLGAIKTRLWKDHAVRDTVGELLAATGANFSVNEGVFRATESFELTFIDSVNHLGKPKPIFQLTGKPLTADEKEHKKLLALIRNPAPPGKVKLPNAKTGRVSATASHPYITPDGHKLDIEKTFINCIWCKADTHPAHKCPFLAVEDWRGPRNNVTTERNEEIKAGIGGKGNARNSSRPTRGGRGSFRGKRGGRGGGFSTGGWQTVGN